MKIIEKGYGKSVTLGIIDTKKFKNDYFSLCYDIPVNEENIANANVLAGVLGRGTSVHGTLGEMNRHLASLYDAGVYTTAENAAGGRFTFRISADVLDSSLTPDNCDVFGGTLDFIDEMLFSPLVKNGEMSADYTESEKRKALDRIKAEKDNKDTYALIRAKRIAYEGTPLALSGKGTPESISAVTPLSVFEMLKYITERCRVYAVFAGNYTDEKAGQLDKFLAMLARKSENNELLETGAYTAPGSGKATDVVESIQAKQGRMVLNFSYDAKKDSLAPVVFNYIFGASPVSRLFMNVRERLSLCYYCSSGCDTAINRITVRSGIDMANRQKAIDEIMRQIALLSEPENISEYELEVTKKACISAYKEISDNIIRYGDMYISRTLREECKDIDELIERVKRVSSSDVSAIARSMALELSYFLDGTEK